MTGKYCSICKVRPAQAGGCLSCSPCHSAARLRLQEDVQHFSTLRHDVKKLTQAVYESGLKAYKVYNWSKETLLNDLQKHFKGIDLSLIET